MSPLNDVTIAVNWHELRILTIWAEQWAAHCSKNSENKSMPKVVKAIAKAIHEQYPSQTPLTLAGEITQLRKHFGKVEVIGPIDSDEDDDIVIQ